MRVGPYNEHYPYWFGWSTANRLVTHTQTHKLTTTVTPRIHASRVNQTIIMLDKLDLLSSELQSMNFAIIVGSTGHIEVTTPCFCYLLKTISWNCALQNGVSLHFCESEGQ